MKSLIAVLIVCCFLQLANCSDINRKRCREAEITGAVRAGANCCQLITFFGEYYSVVDISNKDAPRVLPGYPQPITGSNSKNWVRHSGANIRQVAMGEDDEIILFVDKNIRRYTIDSDLNIRIKSIEVDDSENEEYQAKFLMPVHVLKSDVANGDPWASAWLWAQNKTNGVVQPEVELVVLHYSTGNHYQIPIPDQNTVPTAISGNYKFDNPQEAEHFEGFVFFKNNVAKRFKMTPPFNFNLADIKIEDNVINGNLFKGC